MIKCEGKMERVLAKTRKKGGERGGGWRERGRKEERIVLEMKKLRGFEARE